MANQARQHASLRLIQDLKEIQASPAENVSAAPLDDNMFEWHCNFRFNDVIYHLILFFPDNYPFQSPSAEFVPKGYQFTGGATMDGKKGVRACLSIFSDFAKVHTEWADEKGVGWSPGYTVQTILMNLVSFLGDGDQHYGNLDQARKRNECLARKFSCPDCGHTAETPFPALGKTAGENVTTDSHLQSSIVDYISKNKFDPAADPRDRNDLFGFGLVMSGPANRPTFTTPCEYLSGQSFYGMKLSTGVVHSMMREDLKVFLPMFLSDKHGRRIKTQIEATLMDLSKLMPNCDRCSISQMVLKTIPNLMNTTVVEFSKGTQHTSDNHLNGYFALHRLFLWAIETYPDLQKEVDNRLKEFIQHENKRSKNSCPNIGEWIMLLSGSSKYRWTDVSDAYLMENHRRNVMWYVKDDAKLGYLDTDQKYRLEKTLSATAVSRKLLAFQVCFLDIAMPHGWTRDRITQRYDQSMGLPTENMVRDMKAAVNRIENMKSYDDWFQVLKLVSLSDDELQEHLVKAVEFAIKTDGYKMTHGHSRGGWAQVLSRYPSGSGQGHSLTSRGHRESQGYRDDRRYGQGDRDDRRYDQGHRDDRRYDQGHRDDRRYDQGHQDDRRYDQGHRDDRRYGQGNRDDRSGKRRGGNDRPMTGDRNKRDRY